MKILPVFYRYSQVVQCRVCGHQTVWYVVLDHPLQPRLLGPCPHRKIAYAYAMLSHWYVDGTSAWGRVPRPIAMSHALPAHVRASWLHLFAGNAQVPARNFNCIKAAAYPDRLCAKCVVGCVADESHVFLRCSATALIRDRFRSRLQWSNFFPVFVASNIHPGGELHIATFLHEALRRYQCAPVADLDCMTLRHRRLLLFQGRL